MPTVRFNAVGRCIYCGSKDALSDEHIIPFALGGNYVLPKSSCPQCSRLTARIENFCLRTMFGPLRMKLGLPTRRPKERPETLPIILRYSDGSQTKLEVPIDEYPFALGMLELQPARILRKLPPDSTGRMDAYIWHSHHSEDLQTFLRKHGAVGCRISSLKFETLQFSQMLAKIAHGWAYAHTERNYLPLVPDLLFGRTMDPNYIVGSKINLDLGPTQPDTFFQINIREKKELGVTAVFLRILPNLNSPTYHVAVGISAVHRRQGVQ